MNNLEITIADCEQCLQLEPNNIKALLRKGQALYNQFKYREVHDVCIKILSLDSTNKWAKEKLAEIKLKIQDLPPSNAFRYAVELINADISIIIYILRMRIMDNEVDAKSQTSKPSNPSKLAVEDDFANLIIPNKIIPSKLSKLKSNFAINKNVNDKKTKEKQLKSAQCNDDELITNFLKPQSTPKITEYCNGVIIEEL